MSGTETGEFLTRKQAAAYLATLGYPLSPDYLANLASNDNAGKGPPFIRIGWQTVRYSKVDLKAWFDARAVRVQ